jgi:hypothetical protein
MKIQCKDGIFDTGMNEFSKYNAERMRLQFVTLSRADIRAGKPLYQTPVTVENARAVLEAQVRKEQRKATLDRYMRTTWLLSRTDADLRKMQQVALEADAELPNDVEAEMRKRGLLPALTLDTTSEFAQWVEARAKAAREGRLSAFEDGITH